MAEKTSKNPRIPSESRGIIIEKLPGYFLMVFLILTLVFLVYILRPFLTVLFLGAVLSIAFYPLYRKILRWFKGWERPSSLFMCLFVVIVTILPIAFFILLLTHEGISTYEIIQKKIESGVFDKYLQWEEGSFFYNIKEELEKLVDLQDFDIKANIVNFAKDLSSFLASQTAVLIKNISNIILKFLIMIFAMYYFFKDGDRIVAKIGELSPLPKKHESVLFQKIGSMVNAIVVGVFLTSIIQGIIGGIGFAIAGVSNPVFWGTSIAFFSLVPFVGTAVVWIPAAIVLAILGSYGSAIFIFLWGMLLISSVDNILRPYLIGGKAHTYPLLTFFVIFGGIWSFGFQGIIVGPIVLMIFMAFLHIYEIEYKKILK